MNKVITKDGFSLYALSDDECRNLIESEKSVSRNTYPRPDDGFSVACMTASGNIYPGVSYESNTQTLTMHCEATALANAAIHGEKDVIAITGPNCHMCKQLIYESSLNSGIDVVVVMRKGNKFKQVPISEQMPFPWPEKAVKI